MKNRKRKIENCETNTHDTWDEYSLESVSRKDEEETLQSLGLFEKYKKSCYTSSCDNYWSEYE